MKIIFDNGGGSGGSGGLEQRSGVDAIASSASTVSVTFASPMPDADYSISYSIFNTVDSNPIFLQILSVLKDASGFDVSLNAPTDTANYILEWTVTQNG